jgi:hypothetical protein
MNQSSRPAVTPDILGASVVPAITLLDANTLSMLAAQPRFTGHNESEAIRMALALWREAKRQLDREQRIAAARNRSLSVLQQIKHPKNLPATFKDFLRLIVGGKDEGEQLHRYRRFRVKSIREDEAFTTGAAERQGQPTEKELTQINNEISAAKDSAPCIGIPREIWADWAVRFNKWWAQEKVEAKRRAGNARVAKSRDNKKSAKVN